MITIDMNLNIIIYIIQCSPSKIPLYHSTLLKAFLFLPINHGKNFISYSDPWMDMISSFF